MFALKNLYSLKTYMCFEFSSVVHNTENIIDYSFKVWSGSPYDYSHLEQLSVFSWKRCELITLIIVQFVPFLVLAFKGLNMIAVMKEIAALKIQKPMWIALLTRILFLIIIDSIIIIKIHHLCLEMTMKT
ncbi:hypothetical protein ACJX0J_010458 [Zea mays]